MRSTSCVPFGSGRPFFEIAMVAGSANASSPDEPLSKIP